MADEFDLKPTSRGEEFLDVILRSLGGDTPDIPQPAWRYEEYLAAIANAIQNGGGGSSGGGVLVVHETVTTSGDETIHTLDKTWQEIHDADFAVLKTDSGMDGMIYYACAVGVDEGEYYVLFMYDHPAEYGYSCDSASGYPSYTKGK